MNIQNLSNPFFFLLFKGCFSAALLALFFFLGFYLEIEISRMCGKEGRSMEVCVWEKGGRKVNQVRKTILENWKLGVILPGTTSFWDYVSK